MKTCVVGTIAMMIEKHGKRDESGVIRKRGFIVDFRTFKTKRVKFSSYSAELLGLRLGATLMDGFRFEIEQTMKRSFTDITVTDSISAIRRIFNPIAPSIEEECGRELVHLQDRQVDKRGSSSFGFSPDEWNVADCFTKQSSSKKMEKLFNTMEGEWVCPAVDFQEYK